MTQQCTGSLDDSKVLVMVKSVWANKLGSRTKVELRPGAKVFDLRLMLEQDLPYFHAIQLLSDTVFLDDCSPLQEEEEVSVVVVMCPDKAMQQIKTNLAAVEGFLRKPEIEDELILGTYPGPIRKAMKVIEECQQMLEPRDKACLHELFHFLVRYSKAWHAIGLSEDLDDCMWGLASLYGRICVEPTTPCATDLACSWDSWLGCATYLLHQRLLNQRAPFDVA